MNHHPLLRDLPAGPRWLCAFAAMAALGLHGTRAHAQLVPDNSIGLDATVIPRYQGGESYRVLPLPVLTYSAPLSSSAFLFAEGLNAGIAFPLGRYASAGLLIGVLPGREEDDSDRLNGLGDISTTFEYGAFARAQYGPASADVRFLQAAHSGYGNRVKFTVSYALIHSGTDRVRLSADTVWSNGPSQQTYFGVDAGQAVNSAAGLPAYDPSSGFSRADVSLAWDHRIGEHWSLRGKIGYGTLLGDAADSPVVERRGSAFGSVGAAYRF
jgi:MipA family protein